MILDRSNLWVNDKVSCPCGGFGRLHNPQVLYKTWEAHYNARCVATSRQHPKIGRHKMVSPVSPKVYILGVTHSGRTFRPSDWAERLAGVMSQFRPGQALPGRHYTYSPWCVPTSVEGTRCVILDEALRTHHVMAWDFCMSFAKDNELQTFQGPPPAGHGATPRAPRS